MIRKNEQAMEAAAFVAFPRGSDQPDVGCRRMAKRPPRSVPGQIVLRLISVVLQFVAAACQSRAKLAAENLFLRKQLAMYLERQVKPCRPDDATRITLVVLSRLLDWPRLLTIVKPP